MPLNQMTAGAVHATAHNDKSSLMTNDTHVHAFNNAPLTALLSIGDDYSTGCTVMSTMSDLALCSENKQ